MPYGHNRFGDEEATVAAGATLAVTTAAHDVRLILMDTAAGSVCTLSASEGSGAIFRFFCSVTVTSNDHIIQVANATDEFLGTVYQIDADTSDAIAAYPCLDADGFDTYTGNGTTSGGIKGDYIEIEDAAVGIFRISGTQTGTGTVVTPMSAAV